MADMTTIKGRIAETIYPNRKGAITAESHQALLLEMVDDINAKKADKKEVTFVDEKVTILANETKSSVQNLQDKLSELSERIDNLPQGEEFDAEGNYPSLRVGTADDLAGRGESVPAEFGFRASGGKSIKDGRAYIKRIKGNSVVWNQQSSGESLGGDNGTTKALPQGAKIVQGHKYLILCDKVVNSELYLYYNDGEGKTLTYLNAVSYKFIESSISFIANGQANTEGGMWWYLTNASANDARPRLIDLTQMFQAGNEPTTIEDFNARVATLGVDLNAYNEGQVIHCNTESIKSVGDNAWDEEWENGYVNTTTGELVSSNSIIRNTNIIRVLPNNQYHVVSQADLHVLFYDRDNNYLGWQNNANRHGFTTPQNAYYIRFYCPNTNTYNNDIMITLVHSGWKQDTDAGYQPYWQDTLPLPIIRKYFPDGMKKAGTAHDEIRFNKASGKWEYSKSKTGGGKIKSVDLGTFDYNMGSTNLADSKRMRALTKISDAIIPSNDTQVANILCSRYIAVSANSTWLNREGVCIGVDGYLYVYDKEKQDAATFKAAMQGVILYYESNDWEWVELDAEDQNFRDYYNVADFGTEQSQSSVPSAAFSADIIYQFNAVDMIREHEIEINELQDAIKAMQAQLTSLINGGQ